MPGEVRAAGGVLWRDHGGRVEVAVIHRNRYDDWTMPKGKLHPDESELAAAVREVGEETGAHVAVTRRLPRQHYTVEENVPKTVGFWAMRYLSGSFAPGDEVDGLIWLDVASARERVSYPADRAVLDGFAAVAAPESIVVLLRHAKAGDRALWQGDDRLRPLDAQGRDQAQRLAYFLHYFAPQRILSADRTRCVQTVEPLAALIRVPVETAPAFADEAFAIDPDAAYSELLSVAKSVPASVICSQGTTVPGLVQRLVLSMPSAKLATRKGGAWVLAFADGEIVSADYYGSAAAR